LLIALTTCQHGYSYVSKLELATLPHSSPAPIEFANPQTLGLARKKDEARRFERMITEAGALTFEGEGVLKTTLLPRRIMSNGLVGVTATDVV
jgi:hypothetical protein